MVITPTEEINKIVSLGAGPTSDRAVIKHEILSFEQSRPYKIMQKGVDYYEGRHDILHVQRTMIGPDGSLEAVDNIPNEHIVDNLC